jgi:hypothetical protein
MVKYAKAETFHVLAHLKKHTRIKKTNVRATAAAAQGKGNKGKRTWSFSFNRIELYLFSARTWIVVRISRLK